MVEASQTIELGVQLGSAGLLVLAMTAVHAAGLHGIAQLLRLHPDRLEQKSYNARAIGLMATTALLLFLLHMGEITIFAAFYMAVGALDTLEEALIFSASTYATLGRTEEYFPGEWSLLGSIESLIGFLLIGWSTAFLVSRVNKLEQ